MPVDLNTKSLLQFENNVNDDCGLSWDSVGVLKFDSNIRKFGTSSMVFDGSQYLKLASPKNLVAFGTGDYTVDCWIYLTQYTNNYSIIYMDSNYHLEVGLSGGKPYFLHGPTLSAIAIASDVVPLNTWVHYALVRYNGVTKIYIDGKAVVTYNGTYTVEEPAGFTVGAHAVEFNCYPFIGNIDNFKISNVARWTTDFTPSTEPENVTISAPTNLTATAGDTKVNLSWTAVAGATGYNVKRSTIAGGPYTTVESNVSGTSYIDTSVTNGTTYYYVVTAITVDGESGNSNEASATPVAGSVTPPTPTGNALLRVTMIDSSEREYRLSTAEIDGFVNWYTRTIGTGISCYALNDIVDNSKEYLAFEKIISFKVIPLNK